MITNADINKIKNSLQNSLVNKEYLKKELSKYATKNDLIIFKDAILSEIIKLRDDIAVITGYRELIEDHEIRITKLEAQQKN